MARLRPTLRCERLEDRTTPAALSSEGTLPTVPDKDLAAYSDGPLPVLPSSVLPPPLGSIPKTAFVVGSPVGAAPAVTIYNADGTKFYSLPVMDYFPTDVRIPGAPAETYFTGGVSAALADVTGDGTPDVVAAAGAGGGPRVQVFDGATFQQIRNFFAYDPGFRGGVNVAAGDVTGDGVADVVTGAGTGGAPHVKVFDGTTGNEVRSFLAYDAGFVGGVNVAVAERSSRTGDVWNYSPGNVVTGAGAGGAPHVKVFDAAGATTQSFFAFDLMFRGGVSVTTLPGLATAIADNFAAGTSSTINTVYPAKIAVAQTGGGSKVSVFHNDGQQTLVHSFEPFGGSAVGARLATLDTGYFGFGDLIVAAADGSRVRSYNVGDPLQLAPKLDVAVAGASSLRGLTVG